MDYRTQLQSSLGSAYTLERELGGGGMSRVFLATERRLARTVVVKVLTPELSEGINLERFEREIQLAAPWPTCNSTEPVWPRLSESAMKQCEPTVP